MCLFVRHLHDGLRSPFASGNYGLHTCSGFLCTVHCLEQRCAGCIPRLPCCQCCAHLELCFDGSGTRRRTGLWKCYLWKLPVFASAVFLGGTAVTLIGGVSPGVRT